MKPLRIVADQNMPLVEAFFDHLGEVTRVDGRTLTNQQLNQADLLLVRSITQVDQPLLSDTPVRFVGSATIGTDHVDRDWLASEGIGFANAPGCNAESVVDYVLAALLLLAQRQSCSLTERRIGIVGVGNVGSRLQRRLQALGLEPLLCDPPRAEREGADGFVAIDELLERCDLVCLHTPLTKNGPHPSQHLIDAERLARLQPGAWLLNAGRGPVIDNQALKACLQQRDDLEVVLDVWEPEPSIDTELARLVSLATPHIAGYSLEGKCRGTEMVYQRACQFFGVEPQHRLEQLLPTPSLRHLELTEQDIADSGLAGRLVNRVYDLPRDHQALLKAVGDHPQSIGSEFDRLRREYPERREFSTLSLSGLDQNTATARQLQALGFRLL